MSMTSTNVGNHLKDIDCGVKYSVLRLLECLVMVFVVNKKFNSKFKI